MKRFKDNWNDLEQQLFSRYNDQIGKQGPQGFLTGQKMTWLDFLLACELHQVVRSYKTEIPPNFNHLCNWYDKMMQIPALVNAGKKLDELLVSENLKLDKPEVSNDHPDTR